MCETCSTYREAMNIKLNAFSFDFIFNDMGFLLIYSHEYYISTLFFPCPSLDRLFIGEPSYLYSNMG